MFPLCGQKTTVLWKCDILKISITYSRVRQIQDLAFRSVKVQTEDFLKKDSQHFKNSFQFGFLWIPSKPGKQNWKEPFLLMFIIVKKPVWVVYPSKNAKVKCKKKLLCCCRVMQIFWVDVRLNRYNSFFLNSHSITFIYIWELKSPPEHPIYWKIDKSNCWTVEQWYFVTKIVLTYCEKKLF